MRSAIDMAQKAFEGVEPHDYVMAGETNLMGYEEMANMPAIEESIETSFAEKAEAGAM